MISRATALVIASSYVSNFTSTVRRGFDTVDVVNRDSIYEFLFENDYEAWFCNLAKSPIYVKDFKLFWMHLHTGESLEPCTKEFTIENRRKLGQRILLDLSRDLLRRLENNQVLDIIGASYKNEFNRVKSQLELDGYLYKNGELLNPSLDVLDVEAERSVIHALYKQSNLGRREDAFVFLRLSEEHFLAQRWSDCIANVRKFFELTLQEGARVLSIKNGLPLTEAQIGRPVEVRQLLEQTGLIERKEKELVEKLYGLLSETGAHPYMAESDQARLLRQFAMTMSQFFLLRLSDALKS